MLIRIAILNFYIILLTSKFTVVKIRHIATSTYENTVTMKLPIVKGLKAYRPISESVLKLSPKHLQLSFVNNTKSDQHSRALIYTIELMEMDLGMLAEILDSTGLNIPITWKNYAGTVETFNSRYSKRQVIATGTQLPTGQFLGAMILHDGTINRTQQIARKDVWYFMQPSEFFDEVPFALKTVPTIFYTASEICECIQVFHDEDDAMEEHSC